MATTTDRTTIFQRATRRIPANLSPFARRVGLLTVGAIALVGAGAGTAAAAADAPADKVAYTTATRSYFGVPVKVAAPVAGPADTHVSPVAPVPAAAPGKPAAVKPAVPVKPAAPAKPAPKAPAKPAAKAPAKPAAPSRAQLMPHGIPGGQSSFKVNPHQVRNAATIVQVGKQMNLPPRAWVMAVACSLQESKLTNLGNLGANNDHDSLGLFQQRPASGWGSPHQILNTQYAAKKFYQALRHVPGYRNLPLTVAVQRVQVSAFPQAYAQWEKMAADLVAHTYR